MLKYGPAIGIGFGASTAIFSSAMIALCIQKVYLLHDVIQRMYLGNIYTLIFVLECLDVVLNWASLKYGPTIGIGFGASTAIFSSTMIALCIQKVYILHDVIQKM